MDPIYRDKLIYSLGMLLKELFNGQYSYYNSVKAHLPVDLDHNKIEEILTILGPEDFLSQALRYYEHCSSSPKGHQGERRLVEIRERLDEKYGEFLRESNLLKHTAQKDWLQEALRSPIFANHRGWRLRYDLDNPAPDSPDDKLRTQLKCTIDNEMKILADDQQQYRPEELELLTFSPATIEHSFSLLKPFDYTERYSLHYILLRKYSGDENMTHKEADREARIRLDEYKAEHFERMREESKQLSEWEDREQVRDWKYWKEIEHNPDDFIYLEDLSEDDWSEAGKAEEEGSDDDGSNDDGSEDEESKDDGSGSEVSEGDRSSSPNGMDIDLPEPASEDLTLQVSALRISGKRPNGEGGVVTRTAKKRAFDDSDDTDDAAASGYKRVKVEHWRKRFNKYPWMG